MILRHAMTLVACARVAQAFHSSTLAAAPPRTTPLRSSTADATTGLADTMEVDDVRSRSLSHNGLLVASQPS